MDLLYEDNAPLKANYYKFLSSICKLENKGLSLNQENLYKLFKTQKISNGRMQFKQKFQNGIQIIDSQ